ncbi:MAG: ketol-acid reductoisomerase [bacterium]|nr:ketol-acid reductoisomerase [bacterium]
MAKIYYEKDCNIELLKGKRVAIIGYGAQGHAQAQNLRDSGIDVVVAEVTQSPNYDRAIQDGFKPISAKEAAGSSDYIQLLVPDQSQTKVYSEEIEGGLSAGKVLGFSHGFNIHFGQITPPKDVDVVMIAPKGPGAFVRKVFAEGGGVPCLIAIAQDASGKAKELALAYGAGVGGARAGILETTFCEETETDLFGEQAVLCGGVSELVKAGFDTLVAAGYQPEVAYFECCHELKLLVDLIHTSGISGMREKISDTAKYGDVTRGRRVVNDDTRREMAIILAQIQTGAFAKEWILENQAKRPILNALLNADKNHPIEKIGMKLREMMPWLSKK